MIGVAVALLGNSSVPSIFGMTFARMAGTIFHEQVFCREAMLTGALPKTAESSKRDQCMLVG